MHNPIIKKKLDKFKVPKLNLTPDLNCLEEYTNMAK
jgi:hypothetical protein